LINSITSNPKIRRGVYIFLGLLTLIMLALSFMQIWVMLTVSDMTAYGSVAAGPNGLPSQDQSGAFIILNNEHSPIYQGNLVELLAVTDPVVDPSEGAHLASHEIKSVLIQSSELGDPADYRVIRMDNSDPVAVKYDKQPGNKLLYITPQSGEWAAGDYVLQIPSEGMFGGLTYFQFFIDPEK
jgi:hypothetical protein